MLRWRPPRWMVISSAIGTTVGGAVLFRNWMTKPKGCIELDPQLRANGKVFIVTGSNTGIGKETVRDLAKRGGTVYMACRDMDKCKAAREEIILETKNKNIYCRECDLADFESIRSFVSKFKKEEPRLDVLINNGGVMRNPKMLTKQGIELQLGVNHMGHFLLTFLLLDYLKLSTPSRIVNVSSLAHTQGKINFDDLNSEKAYDPGQAYNQSKLANILFTKELAERLEGTGVTANSLHPGLVKTEIFRYMGFDKSFLASIFVKPLLSLIMKTPVQGAQTTLYVALEPSLEKVTGKYFSDCKEKEPSKDAQDPLIAKKLWATSEKWTNVNY